MFLTPALLALAICAVWLPSVTLDGRLMVAPWIPLTILAGICGVMSGNLTPAALAGMSLLSVTAWLSTHRGASHLQTLAFTTASLSLALLLALHRWPGFNNPPLIDAIRFSPDSIPFTLYANLDKGAAGLLLLALCCKRSGSWTELKTALRATWWIMVLGVAIVMMMGMALHLIKPDPKWPAEVWVFLGVNLLFTVVAEEAFFRGVVQERLSRFLGQTRFAAAACLMFSALLFGAAHSGGGVRYAVLATVAGLMYAWVYHRSRKIETAIAAHFLLNAVHFSLFTYPALQ